MQDYQKLFIEFALERKVLRFGEFTLKSGRISPYFFNSGLFNSGNSLGQLGKFYAQAIKYSQLDFDMLFGPSYKGIPLVCAVVIALFHEQQRDVPYCFDRKEMKDHAEGGVVIGAPLQGKVLIVDDVITAGLSVNHAINIIHNYDATPAGLVIALDRQEQGQGAVSAVQEMEQRHGLKVISIISLDNIVDYLSDKQNMAEHLTKISEYRDKYGT